jgi:tetraacyldisaccharide 4'-kinase
MTLDGKRFRSLSDPSRAAGPDAFAGKRIAAIAGIGNPARFFDHLRALGLDFTEHRLADHYRYSASELEFAGADFVLMTEKDGIKCTGLADARMWILPVAATLSEGLIELVLERVGARPAPRAAIVSLNANRKR